MVCSKASRRFFYLIKNFNIAALCPYRPGSHFYNFINEASFRRHFFIITGFYFLCYPVCPGEATYPYYQISA